MNAAKVLDDLKNPVLRSAISIVCNAELTAPRGDGVGLGPQFLSLLRVVLQHFIDRKSTRLNSSH